MDYFSRRFNLPDDKFSIFYTDLNLLKDNFSKFCVVCTSRLVNLLIFCVDYILYYSFITNLRFLNENLSMFCCFVLLSEKKYGKSLISYYSQMFTIHIFLVFFPNLHTN